VLGVGRVCGGGDEQHPHRGGDRAAGFSGDGCPATAAQLSNPSKVAVTADGGFLISDRGNHRVRRVSPAGTITTVAGTGAASSGDGGPATAAPLLLTATASGQKTTTRAVLNVRR